MTPTSLHGNASMLKMYYIWSFLCVSLTRTIGAALGVLLESRILYIPLNFGALLYLASARDKLLRFIPSARSLMFPKEPHRGLSANSKSLK
jgi:hypothetical protein